MLKEDAVKGIGVDAVCSIEGKHNSRTHNGLLFFFWRGSTVASLQS